ncbi:MerC domain-containing protein [Sphingomonas sp.]|uniref:MerC domain-containing protein n=1 Tax=Sphingomonas sp. TaxID=28214 RepID=UPI00345DFADA
MLRNGTIDRIAVTLSGLCLVHCVATVVLLGLVSSVASWLGNPLIHEIGLGLATGLGAIALVGGAMNHRSILPTAIGFLGLGFMASALIVPHGGREALLTIIGVSLLAGAHWLNRKAHGPGNQAH